MDTPVYRQLVDDSLFELLKANLIDIKMYLENSSLPFADKLLNDINQREKEMMQQQQMPAQLLEQLAQAGNQIPQDQNSQVLLNKLLNNGKEAA